MERLHRLQEVAEAIVRRAGERAADVEVRIVRRDAYGFELRNRELAPQIAVGRVSVGLRALGPEGLSLAATTTLDVDENVAALEASLPSGRPTPLGGFAGETRPADLSGHDPAWEAWLADPALLRDLAVELREGLYGAHGGDPALESLEGGLGLATTWTALATRHGSAAFQRTSGGAFAQVNALHHRSLHLGRAPDGAGRAEVARLAARTFEDLPRRTVTPADVGAEDRVPVILHPSLLESMLRDVAQEKLLGASAGAGMTELAPGRRIWDPGIDLWDSGVEAGLATTRPVDDELVPTRRTALVTGGAVASLVWSRRSAAEAGRASTGNGYRSPMLVEDPSEAPIRDRLSGLVMAPGELSLEALFRRVERGLYVIDCLGLHGADRARAAFSTTVYDGFWIEDGEVVALLAPGAWNLSGNLFPSDDGPGLLADVERSRETFVTGSARLPWVATTAAV